MDMKLPKKIKIGYRDFKVDDMPEHKLEEFHGHIDLDQGVIQISQQFGDSKTINTVLHEIIHGGFHINAIGLDRDLEEQITTAMSNYLCQVMRDNKPLFRDLLEHL
jgi:hypothetical protein